MCIQAKRRESEREREREIFHSILDFFFSLKEFVSWRRGGMGESWRMVCTEMPEIRKNRISSALEM